DLVESRTLLDRIFVVGFSIDLLGFVGDEIFQQLDGFRLVRRILGYSRAANIDLCAAILEGRQNHLDGVAPLHLLLAALARAHQADIIGVGDADIANAAEDVLGNVAVAAAGLASQVFLDAGKPLLGVGRAVVGDVVGKERGVIGMLAGANANLAL